MSLPRQHEYMYGSNPLHAHQTSKTNLQSETELHSKTVTRFPPIKSKAEDTPNLKENLKQTTPSTLVGRKQVEENTFNIKKTNTTIRKRVQKKKTKQMDIKPQLLQKYKQFVDFLGLVNLTNNLKVQITEHIPPYVLYVGKGNNSSLIKNLFRTNRPWWTLEQNNPDNPSINLYWFQLKQNEILDNFKQNIKNEGDFEDCTYYGENNQEKPDIINTEKEVRETSKKSKNSIQTRSQSVTQKDIKSTFKVALTKRSSSRTKGISQQKTTTLNNHLVNLGKEAKEQGDIQQAGKNKKALANPKMWPIYNNYRRIFSQSELKQIKKLKVIQQDGKIYQKMSRNKVKCYQNRSNYFKMHNHVTNNWNLSNKKALFMNLKSYYEAQKINPFDFIPMTFHITDVNDKEFLRFSEQYERRTQNIKEQQKKQKTQQLKYGYKPKKRNAWLVKPGENTNRGNGIEVVESIEEIKQKIEREKVDTLGRPRTHIVQQYIMPFLYQKRKFDIRCYVCLTSINGHQKGYWFQDGYIRTASKEFNMKNLNNKFIHLTNDAVQKYHEDYGKFQPANKLSYADFQRYLDTVYNSNSQNGQKYKFYQQAYPQMKKLASDIFRSVYTKINPTKKEFTFEVFGLDYMIDQNFKVWLIQVNTNPCLELACPLLGRIIPTMLQNAFKLVVDPIFPPPAIEQLVGLSKKIILPDNLLQSNKFELIFDEAQQVKELKALLSSAPKVKIEQVQQQDDEYDDEGEVCEKPKYIETR